MAHRHKAMEELAAQGRVLRDLIPNVYAANSALSRAVMVDGALTRCQKELIALAISVTRECDGCVDAHARGAVRAGASREEVAEAMGVAIYMNGGPGTVWGPRALAAYDELTSEGA